jgi:hypothetical protein
MFNSRPKQAYIPSAVSDRIPDGTIIESFHMDFGEQEEVRVGVVEVPAKRLSLIPVAGSSKKAVALKTVISGVAVCGSSVEYDTVTGKTKTFSDGDVIVYVSHNFKRFSGLFRTKARQIVIAYEAARAYGFYREATTPNACVYNTLAIEECAIQYLATLDYHEWSVYGALKKLGALNEKESRRFYRALKKLNKKRDKVEQYVEDDDIAELMRLTA